MADLLSQAEDGSPDWLLLGARLAKIEAQMIHAENSPLCGGAFYGEALRRLLDNPGSGFVAEAQHRNVLEANRYVDRANGERAEAALREARERHAAKLGTIRADIASALRARADLAGGKYRAEGVRIAADWIDPPEATELRAEVLAQTEGTE